MKTRAKSSLLVLALLSASVLSSLAVPASAKQTTGFPNNSACISNSFLAAQVETPSDGSNVGQYTLATGSCPISESTGNPNMILYPLGTSFNSIFDMTTNSIYTASSLTPAGSSGATVTSLDGSSPTLITSTATEVKIGWTTGSGLAITEDITIVGTTASASGILITMGVTNNNDARQTIATRDLLDTFIGDYDGTWIQQYNGVTPGAITGLETDYNPPPATFTSYAMSGCTSNPCTPGNFGT